MVHFHEIGGTRRMENDAHFSSGRCEYDLVPRFPTQPAGNGDRGHVHIRRDVDDIVERIIDGSAHVIFHADPILVQSYFFKNKNG